MASNEASNDLQWWIERLVGAARGGTLVDLCAGAADGAPASLGQQARTLPASALREVLTRPELTVDPRGLRIHGARIIDDLDLAHIVFPHPLDLTNCSLEATTTMAAATFKELRLSGTHAGELILDGIEIGGDLLVDRGFRARGGVRLSRARIGGDLALGRATIIEGEGDALNLEGAKIGGSVLAIDGFTAEGAVTAAGADIGGSVVFAGASLTRPGHDVLVLEGAKIGGSLVAIDGFAAHGRVRAPGLRIGRSVVLRNATLTNPGAQVLVLNNADIFGDLRANGGFRADGTVLVVGAQVGGELDFRDATFECPHADALVLNNTEVKGDIHANDNFQATGAVRAAGINVGGSVLFSGATISNPGDDALVLDGCQIGGFLRADAGFAAHGAVRALGSRVGRSIMVSGARLSNPGGDAVDLGNAELHGDLLGDSGFYAQGAVRAAGAHIGGGVDLRGATVINPGGVTLVLNNAEVVGDLQACSGFRSEGDVEAIGARLGRAVVLSDATFSNRGGNALTLDRIEITRSLLADTNFRCEGTLRAVGARIGAVTLTEASLYSPDGDALNLEAATVAGTLRIGSDVDGTIILRRAVIGNLVLPESEPTRGILSAAGWQVGDIQGPLRTSWRMAHQWLKAAPADNQSAQSWHALATVYDRNGQPADARRLRFAAANRVTAEAPWPTKLTRTIYLCVVGHGYYPLLAGLWLAAMIFTGVMMVAVNADQFIPTNPDAATRSAAAYAAQSHSTPPALITGKVPCQVHPSYPCLNPLTYFLSGLVPTVGVTTSDWTARSDATLWLTVCLPLIKLIAWALTALLLAGVTGLLRRT